MNPQTPYYTDIVILGFIVLTCLTRANDTCCETLVIVFLVSENLNKEYKAKEMQHGAIYCKGKRKKLWRLDA